MKLKQIDRIHPELFADEVGILENMLRRKHIAVLVLRQRRPPVIARRDLRSGIEPLAWVTSWVTSCVARHNLAEQAIALAFSVSPCGVKKIATQIHGQLHRSQRLLIVRAAPSAHSPQSLGDVADVESGTAELAVFHEGLSIGEFLSCGNALSMITPRRGPLVLADSSTRRV